MGAVCVVGEIAVARQHLGNTEFAEVVLVLRAGAVTVEPARVASWIAVLPTPPVAPTISTTTSRRSHLPTG
jgi:hypothetical protein